MRKLRKMFANVRKCSPMFANVRQCSQFFFAKFCKILQIFANFCKFCKSLKLAKFLNFLNFFRNFFSQIFAIFFRNFFLQNIFPPFFFVEGRSGTISPKSFKSKRESEGDDHPNRKTLMGFIVPLRGPSGFGRFL